MGSIVKQEDASMHFTARAFGLTILLLSNSAMVMSQDENADGQRVTYVPADQVTQALENSGLMVSESDLTVIGAYRDSPGQPEAHMNVTDIYYVVAGAATLVTGGRLEESPETRPGEFLGGELVGGTERNIAAGDVVVIPPGIPHWYKDVPVEVSYYLVKVIRPE
jgi:mannose-6-phosphate isomerase-like protein (cupin superfamily)